MKKTNFYYSPQTVDDFRQKIYDFINVGIIAIKPENIRTFRKPGKLLCTVHKASSFKKKFEMYLVIIKIRKLIFNVNVKVLKCMYLIINGFYSGKINLW